MEIKFCENNFTHGTDDVIAKLVDEHPEVKVVVEPCLGQCGDCAPGPFAIVAEELVIAKNCKELYQMIQEII